MVRPILLICLLAGGLRVWLPCQLLWRLARLRSPWPPRFLALAAWSIGARVKIVGKPLGHDAFYVSNHLNWVDILALGGHGRCAFVAHDGIAGWPIIGWLAEQNHTIFVAQESRRHVHLQIEELREALSTHQPIALFPEGTTGDGATLL